MILNPTPEISPCDPSRRGEPYLTVASAQPRGGSPVLLHGSAQPPRQDPCHSTGHGRGHGHGLLEGHGRGHGHHDGYGPSAPPVGTAGPSGRRATTPAFSS
eukprot:1397953-Rhodomonas_salina.2